MYAEDNGESLICFCVKFLFFIRFIRKTVATIMIAKAAAKPIQRIATNIWFTIEGTGIGRGVWLDLLWTRR